MSLGVISDVPAKRTRNISHVNQNTDPSLTTPRPVCEKKQKITNLVGVYTLTRLCRMRAVVTILTLFSPFRTQNTPQAVMTFDIHTTMSSIFQAASHARTTDTEQKPSRSRPHQALDTISGMSQVPGRCDNSVGVETNHEGNWGQSRDNARMDGVKG